MKLVEYRRIGERRPYFKLAFDSPQEEKDFFNETCERILGNTRWYLDHLDECMEFKVSWNDYHKHSKFLSKTGKIAPKLAN